MPVRQGPTPVGAAPSPRRGLAVTVKVARRAVGRNSDSVLRRMRRRSPPLSSNCVPFAQTHREEIGAARDTQATIIWHRASDPCGAIRYRYCALRSFGPNDEDAKPVQWVVERLIDAWSAGWGEGARWQLDPNPQPHEAHYLKLDCAKA